MTTTDLMIHCAESWGHFMVSRTVDMALIFLIVLAVWGLARKKVPAQFGYYLFLLVLLKPIVPVQHPAPISVSGAIASVAQYFPSLESEVPSRESAIATIPTPAPENSTPSAESEEDWIDEPVRENDFVQNLPAETISNYYQNESITSQNDITADQAMESPQDEFQGKSKLKTSSKSKNFEKIASAASDDSKTRAIFKSASKLEESSAAAVTKTSPLQKRNAPASFANAAEKKPEKSIWNPFTALSIEVLEVWQSISFASVLLFAKSIPPIPAIGLGWAIIALFLLARFTYREWKTMRIIQQSDPVLPEDLPVCFNQLLKIAGVRRLVRLASSSWVKSPFVYGVWKPTLLVPTNFVHQYTEKQIRWILLHELAHIQRWDTLVKLYQKIVQYVFFFHPAVWIASRIIDSQREYACDAAAVYGAKLTLHDCGESFLRVVVQSNCTLKPAPGLLGLASSKQIVKERLMRILAFNRNLHFRISPPLVLILLGIMAAVLPFSGAVKAEDANPAVPVAQAVKSASPAAPQADASAQPAASSSPVAGQSIDGLKKPYPTDGWELDEPGNNYIWKRTYQTQADAIKRVELLTQDGDIVVQPQEDQNVSAITAQADIIIHVNDKKANLTEDEILAIKKDVDVITVIDIETFTLRSDLPKEKPKGVSISVNLTVYLPPAIAVAAKTEDGDITLDGIKESVEAVSQDGDIVAQNSTGPVRVNTEDGDIVLTEIANNAEAVTQDGDIVVTSCHGAVLAKTEDGDVVLTETGNNATATSQDGDIVITVCKGAVVAKTKDGGVTLTEIAHNAEAAAQDGDVTITSCKGAVVATTEDGDISLTDLAQDVTATNQSGDITITACKGSVRAKSGDGDISLTDIAQNVDAVGTKGSITATECKGSIHAANESGDIVLEGVEKKVDITSNEGEVVIKYFTPPTEDCTIASVDGSVSITVPSSAKLNLDFKSVSGEIDFDKTDFSGSSDEKNASGTLNGGGPAVKVQTQSGDISFQRE